MLVSWFEGGEVFRSGCCYERGRGRIFYFRPGHETHPTYFEPEVRPLAVERPAPIVPRLTREIVTRVKHLAQRHAPEPGDGEQRRQLPSPP